MNRIFRFGLLFYISLANVQSTRSEQNIISLGGQVSEESDDARSLSRHRRAAGTAVPFTQAEKDAGLKMHNDKRASQGASNMEYMEWHPELARMAQDYVEGCLYEHSSQTNDGCYNVSYTNVGENLQYHSEIVDLAAAVTQWYSEEDHYDFDKGECAEGQVCGHYTQVVWWNSELVGCGRAKCPKLRENTGVAATDAYFISCNYGARGNYGKERPFTKGSAASACAPGMTDRKGGMCYKSGVDYQRSPKKLRSDCKSGTEQSGTQKSTDPDGAAARPRSLRLHLISLVVLGYFLMR